MELQVLGWRVRADREATFVAHSKMSRGDPESCGCLYCQNYAASRQQAYPPSAVELFATLGIQGDRESQIGTPLRMAEGRWLYSGWFHFVGEIVQGPGLPSQVTAVPPLGGVNERTIRPDKYESLVEGFTIALSNQVDRLPEAFRGLRVVQLEFATEVPWLLSEQEPTS